MLHSDGSSFPLDALSKQQANFFDNSGAIFESPGSSIGDNPQFSIRTQRLILETHYDSHSFNEREIL